MEEHDSKIIDKVCNRVLNEFLTEPEKLTLKSRGIDIDSTNLDFAYDAIEDLGRRRLADDALTDAMENIHTFIRILNTFQKEISEQLNFIADRIPKFQPSDFALLLGDGAFLQAVVQSLKDGSCSMEADILEGVAKHVVTRNRLIAKIKQDEASH